MVFFLSLARLPESHMPRWAYKHSCIFVVIKGIFLLPETLCNRRVQFWNNFYLLPISQLKIILSWVGCVTNNCIYLNSILLTSLTQSWSFRTVTLFPGCYYSRCNNTFFGHGYMGFKSEEWGIRCLMACSGIGILGERIMIFSIFNSFLQEV